MLEFWICEPRITTWYAIYGVIDRYWPLVEVVRIDVPVIREPALSSVESWPAVIVTQMIFYPTRVSFKSAIKRERSWRSWGTDREKAAFHADTVTDEKQEKHPHPNDQLFTQAWHGNRALRCNRQQVPT